VGFQYQDQKADYTTDYLIHAQAPLYIKCLISEEACSGDSSGGYNSKEFYAEALIPIAKNLPGVELLNLDIGVRHSNYSLFGATTKSQAKLEYKPVKTVLLRSTFAQVFRAPTLIDLYAAPLNTSSTFADPCYGTNAASVAANPNVAKACDGAWQQNGAYAYNGTSQVTGLITSNPTLKPETGHVWTAGFVVQAPFVENLALTADYWNYDIKNIITQLDPNYSVTQCLATGADQFCSLIHRYTTGNNQGQMEVFGLPNVNLGELKTDGVDADLTYTVHSTPVGSFKFDLSGTFLNSYDSIALAGSAPLRIAGTYDRQFGNYAKYRSLGVVSWSYLDFEALFSTQFIDHLVVKHPATQAPGVHGGPNPDLQVPSIIYFNMTFGYTVKASNTKVMAGMQNIADKQPPVLYQNNVVNANTDVSTYDTIGRRFFLSFQQKF
jgi:iron complex outermembrane recepter protein